MTAAGASISGKITASSGSITGGLTIGSNGYFTTNASRTTYNSTSATGITITSSGIGGYGSANSYFNMTTGGKLTCVGADIKGAITATSGTFTGTINANDGSIGGWTLGSNMMYSSSNAPAANNVFMMPSGTSSSYTIAGHASTGWVFTSGTTFGVTKSGGLYATGATINGVLTANANSQIGPWTVADTAIYKVSSTMGNATAGSAYFGNNGLSITNRFKVSSVGSVTINNGVVTTTIDGTIMLSDSSDTVITSISTSSVLTSAPIISSKASASGNIESAIMAQNQYSTGEMRVYVANAYRSGSLVASSGSNLGIYDHGGDNWVIRSANNGSVYIPHVLYVTSISGTGDCPVIGTGTGDNNNKVARIYSSTDVNGRVKFNMNSRSSTFTDIYYVDCNSSSSDIRLKTNVANTSVANARALIDLIKIREFDWIDGRENVHQNIGFIADELEKLDPKLAIGGGYEEDGSMCIKSVDTFYLLGYLTKAFQELSAEVTSLRNEIKQLKSER